MSHVKAIGNAAPCVLGLLRHSAGTDCLGKEHRAGTSGPVMSTGEAAWGDSSEPGTGQRQFPGSEAELSSPGGRPGFIGTLTNQKHRNKRKKIPQRLDFTIKT